MHIMNTIKNESCRTKIIKRIQTKYNEEEGTVIIIINIITEEKVDPRKKMLRHPHNDVDVPTPWLKQSLLSLEKGQSLSAMW